MEAQDQTRIESRIAELKYKMWDRLPPTYLPSGELIINTNIESRPTITFTIPARSTDAEDENGEFGIRKNDTNWQIYSVSNGEVIKQSTSYSKFFDGSDWDPGTSEPGGNIFTASKQIPVTIHEKIDGTVRSSKDINYKYPQIFDIEWNQTGEKGNSVTLNFTIRKDIRDFTLSYSSTTPSKYTAVSLEPIRSSSVGTSYQWTLDTRNNVPGEIKEGPIGPIVGKRTISFLIVTGINQDLETELTYTVQ
jgi:hypothetical protein